MRFQFVRPEMLFLLAVLPLGWLIGLLIRRSAVAFPRTSHALVVARGHWYNALLAALPTVLRSGAIVCLAIVLAGPILIYKGDAVEQKEIAMVMAIDLSSSMMAEDVEEGKNRMQVARETAVRFLQARQDDRIGLVAFAGEALTRIPPTNDQDVVIAGVESLDMGLLEDGTDISEAILTSTNRLIEEPHNTRVLVLLTDGAHNADGVSPLVAAQAAAAHQIKIYAVSILGEPGGGSESQSELAMTQHAQLANEVETVLTQVARVSGGRYFNAENGAGLDSIYSQIDQLETTSVSLLETTETKPVQTWFLAGALLLICAEALARGSRWGVVP